MKITKTLRDLFFTVIFFASGGKPKALAQGPMDMPTLYGAMVVQPSPNAILIIALMILVPIVIIAVLIYLLFKKKK